MMRRSIPAGTRRWPVVVIGIVILLFIIFTVMSGFYVDLLWFREVDLSSVFWTVLRAKMLLGLVFGLLFFGLLFTNLLIVRRIRPTTRILTPEQEMVERVRQNIEPYLRWLIPLGAAVLALLVGIGVSGQWRTFLLWRNGSGLSFGSPEPLFGRDPAFYVFSLPWLRFVQGWLFSSLVGVTVIVGIAHFLWGGIQPQAPAFADKVSPAVRAHLSVLLGLIMVAKAWGYYLGRFDLLTSPRGVVEGASYTDVHAQLPALNFLAIVAVICAVLFLVNIRVRLWSLPVIAVGLLALVSVLLGTAYPAFVQQFSVKPQEQQRETPYIQDNIEGTQRAFQLDTIDVSERPADLNVSADALDENAATVSNIRLWRPRVLGENFQSLQRIRQYYEFHDVDVDRYPIGDEPRVLMVSGREISQDGIAASGRSWQNQHLVYTHGYGAVAAQVNTATSEGAPILTLKDIPPSGVPEIDQPRIYFGEVADVPFVMTNTGAQELDYDGAPPGYTYDGQGGIPVGNIVQRALFAWRFKDVNLLISGLIKPDSRIMIYRSLDERVPKPAPFLTYDKDPYLAVVSGRLTWIWDAYTTTDEYPYSQDIDLSTATDRDLQGHVNYIRNSVKVTVDAYDGSMKYYIIDTEDPIVQAWSAAFPDLFTRSLGGSGRPGGAFPIPRGPVPGAGHSVRHLSRDGSGGLLPEAGCLADPERPNHPRERARGDRRFGRVGTVASLLLVDAAAGRDRRAVHADPPVHAGRAAEPGVVDGGQLRSRLLRRHGRVHVPGGAKHRRPHPGLRADQPGPGLLNVPNAARSAGVDHRLRRLLGDPHQRLAAVRAARLRAIHPGELDPRAEACGRRQWRYGGSRYQPLRSTRVVDHRPAVERRRGAASRWDDRRAGREPARSSRHSVRGGRHRASLRRSGDLPTPAATCTIAR